MSYYFAPKNKTGELSRTPSLFSSELLSENKWDTFYM